MGRKTDLTNRKFGKLTALDSSFNNLGKVVWNCICDCGNYKTVLACNLVSNNSTSCGCYMKEVVIQMNTTHGRTKTPEYKAWQNIKNRCLYEKDTHYQAYGGRGIKICDRWINSFENFISDMGERPIGYSIDRIDVNGNYEPTNCRWIPLKDQARNKRSSKLDCEKVKYIRESSLTSMELSKEFNVSHALISSIRRFKIWI